MLIIAFSIHFFKLTESWLKVEFEPKNLSLDISQNIIWVDFSP